MTTAGPRQDAPGSTTTSERWLRPGAPRRRAAALLLLLAVTHLLCWLLLYVFLGVDRAPGVQQDVTFAAMAVVPVVAVLGTAVLALTGSAAARLLGVLTVVSTAASTVTPVAALGSYDSPLLSTTTLYALPFAGVLALSAAVVVVLALPGHAGHS